MKNKNSLNDELYLAFLSLKFNTNYYILNNLEFENILLNTNLLDIDFNLIQTKKIIGIYDRDEIFFIILIDLESCIINIFDYDSRKLRDHNKILYNWNKYYYKLLLKKLESKDNNNKKNLG